MGPAPFFAQVLPEKAVWLLVVSLFGRGLFNAWFFVSILPEMFNCCQEAGLHHSLQLDSMVSCLYTGFINLGSFVGPFAGGFMNNYLGFPWSTAIVSIFLAAKALVAAIFFAYNRRTSHTSYEKIEDK
ncbi:MFS-type transporter SLC18B1-like [Exaiptasia diaphana]|nr:MFS-type transporter SLC18B1-like [Exaiptasia diaphana]